VIRRWARRAALAAGRLREETALAVARWPRPLRLLALGVLVGCVSGLGAVVFDALLGLALAWFVHAPLGYAEPARGAAAEAVARAASSRSLLWLCVPAAGALLSGLVVFLVAPEAEGHGTDAMIEAFHHRGGHIRKRVPAVKIVASALTIGSGGSAGKEGPIAQIGSGFGSAVASALRLKPKERRIMVLAGAAGGIGAIFQAPLGAALFAPEVLYRETEFEYEAILPCIISSIVAYSVFSSIRGRYAIFFPGPVDAALPRELLPYALFGVVCAAVGRLYIEVFYGLRNRFFRRIPLPRIVVPALGGLFVGAIALFFPQVTDGGYGWVQAAMEGKIFWGTMALLALLKIAATACTIGSGGSGGVFGPSVFIGAMLGGAFGFLGHAVAPEWVVNPNSFVLVGIGGFFAGVAKVPVASVIMACEMSSSYTLLVPLMLVSSVSYLLLGRHGLYEKQAVSRLASPAHLTDFAGGLLEKILVRDAMSPGEPLCLPEEMPFEEVVRSVTGSRQLHFPVVDREGRMTGIVSINDIREFLFEEEIGRLVVARDVATASVVCAYPEETLKTALEKMAAIGVDELPVTEGPDRRRIVGFLSKRDIVDYYHARSGA